MFTCRMDLIDKQLESLTGEIKDVAAEIKELYDQLAKERNAEQKTMLESRIEKLQADKQAFISGRNALLNKVETTGMATQRK